jgi:polyhydroxybutyrate depolymerase
MLSPNSSQDFKTVTHYFISICEKIQGACKRTTRTHCVAVAFGALIVMALNAASLTAAAHGIDTYPEPDVAASEPGAEAPEVVSAAATGASTGCGKRAIHTGVFNLHTTDGDKRYRTFLVEVPAEYNPSRAYSLNFVFHGAGGSSSQSYSWGLQNVTGASENGIFVFPDGINFQHYGVGWDDTRNGYDMPFFDNMVKALEADFCVNRARVFVAGFSWGGDFVTALVCNRGNTIRAAAANSTTDEFNDASKYYTYQGLPCSTTVHPALRFEHAVGGDAEYPAPRFASTSALYRHLNSCSSASASAHSSTSVMSCVSYKSCTKEYVECSFRSSIGHALPPNWAKDTWAFFQGFP